MLKTHNFLSLWLTLNNAVNYDSVLQTLNLWQNALDTTSLQAPPEFRPGTLTA